MLTSFAAGGVVGDVNDLYPCVSSTPVALQLMREGMIAAESDRLGFGTAALFSGSAVIGTGVGQAVVGGGDERAFRNWMKIDEGGVYVGVLIGGRYFASHSVLLQLRCAGSVHRRARRCYCWCWFHCLWCAAGLSMWRSVRCCCGRVAGQKSESPRTATANYV